MKNTKRMMVLVMCVMMTTFCFAQNSKSAKLKNMNEDIQKGIELHDEARKEGMKAAEEAEILLKPYINENAIARAYYGSVQTVMAGIVAEGSPIKALEYLQIGGDFIDEAVEMSPNDAFVRMIRLENGIEVSKSSPINRYSVIKKDVKWFIDEDNISKVDDELKAEAYLYCGYYKIEAGDLDAALELFEECVDVNPKSDYAKLANRMLDKYTE